MIPRQRFIDLEYLLSHTYDMTAVSSLINTIVFGVEDGLSPVSDGKDDVSIFQEHTSQYKNNQINGFISLLTKLFTITTEHIIDIGCGNGLLTQTIAERYPSSSVVGVDRNDLLIRKNISKNSKIAQSNLHYFSSDVADLEPTATDLVIGLHCCGSLTDTVIQYAINNKSSIAIVPCCFGKTVVPKIFSKTIMHLGYSLVDIYSRERQLEGRCKDGRGHRYNIILEGLRTLINLDRAFFLQEQGYDVSIHRITSRYWRTTDTRCYNTSLNQIIVGKLYSSETPFFP